MHLVNSLWQINGECNCVQAEQVIGMAMLAFDDVTSVRAQQHTLHVIPCGDCSLVGLALSFSVSNVYLSTFALKLVELCDLRTASSVLVAVIIVK